MGKEAALASGLVSEEDFKAAGPTGAVVRGMDGRIAIAASRDSNIMKAIECFLYIVRMRHGGTALGDKIPETKAPTIREFSVIDWPPFGPV